MPKTDKRRVNGQKTVKEPLWKGPEIDGVTQGLLGRFLSCRERFRVWAIEGLRPPDAFSSRLEFGNMWHVCEECHARGCAWGGPLAEYIEDLLRRYPFSRDEIMLFGGKCEAMFPCYVKHWQDHPDVRDRQPIFQEQVFDVPYLLPSGRTVRLRGKWDSVDLIGKGKGAGVWLQENKTKSSIDAQKLTRQLGFDLQTMLYLVALKESRVGYGERGYLTFGGTAPVLGVRYNVVRRPAHKSVESALKKLEEDRRNGRIGEWFARWNVTVTPGDLERFRRECLDPVLEQLWDWWEWVSIEPDNLWRRQPDENYRTPHFRFPYGVYNPVAEGGEGNLDEYLNTGGTVGLHRVDNLFPELKEG